MKDLVRIEKRDGIAWIRLNNPERLNVLSPDMLDAIEKAFQGLEKDEEVEVVILTGEGKAFAAGADIKVMSQFNAEEATIFARRGQGVMNYIESFRKPVIAAINGYALGGGMELAMACDIRIASEEAVLGQPEVKLGLIPGFGGTQRLTRLLPWGKAKEMILTGENVSAEEAHRIGLVEHVFPKEKLLEEAEKIARKIMEAGPRAVKWAKAVIHQGRSVPFQAACALEAEAFGLLFSTEEPREGLNAFLEKRKPNWRR
jgi:enoyl-CoA hydratase/carnithine racemase